MHRVHIAIVILATAVVSFGQATPAPAPDESASVGMGHRAHRQGVAGTITALDDHSLTIKTMDGQTATVNLSEKTQFRKDRQPVKLADFKVGDAIFVGGQSTGENVWQADFVAMRSGTRGDMPGGGAQHFVGGEIKSIDGMQITLARPDGTTQTVTVDENTSFHKGEESITLADLHPGDHVFGRGDMKNGVFVPATLTVGDPHNMWQKPPNSGSGGGPR